MKINFLTLVTDSRIVQLNYLLASSSDWRHFFTPSEGKSETVKRSLCCLSVCTWQTWPCILPIISPHNDCTQSKLQAKPSTFTIVSIVKEQSCNNNYSKVFYYQHTNVSFSSSRHFPSSTFSRQHFIPLRGLFYSHISANCRRKWQVLTVMTGVTWQVSSEVNFMSVADFLGCHRDYSCTRIFYSLR